MMEQVTVFALPAFMFVSGFFAAFATGRSRRTLGWDAVGARIKALLIPYTIWTLVLIAFGFVQGQRHGLAQYVTMYLTGRVNPAYYYVPLLVQLYLLAPFLIPLARERPVTLLVITGLIQLAVQLSYFPALLGTEDPTLLALGGAVPKWLFVSRIFWFAAGIVAGFHLAKLRGWLDRAKWGLVIAAIVLIPLGMAEWEVYARAWSPEWLSHRETLIDSLYTIAVIGSVLAFSGPKLPLSRPIEGLGSRTYGIYLTHLPAMETFARVIYHVAPALLGYQDPAAAAADLSGAGGAPGADVAGQPLAGQALLSLSVQIRSSCLQPW